MSYKIRLNIFEGPFDLLVYLIESAEMSIYDIQISVITRQYLDHIRMMEEHNIVVSSEFLVLAATLIDIKSKMLLPRIKEDGGETEDPRTDLSVKLAEYVRFKKASAALEGQREFAQLKLQKPQEDLLQYTGEPDIYLHMEMASFIDAFKNFIHRRIKGEELQRLHKSIERERLSFEKKVSFIKRILTAARNAKQKMLKFTELLSGEPDRADRVVTLVAVLDMANEGILKIRQKNNFGEIDIIPKYGEEPKQKAASV
jgi:segregation and condensation protein A